MAAGKTSNQPIEELEAKLEKKYQAKAAKKRPRMPVSGKKVFSLKKIITNKK